MATDTDKFVVVEGDEPRPKRQSCLILYKIDSLSKPREFPGFLRNFQQTDVLRRAPRMKCPSGRPKKSPSTESMCTASRPPPDENSKLEKGAARCIYQSQRDA